MINSNFVKRNCSICLSTLILLFLLIGNSTAQDTKLPKTKSAKGSDLLKKDIPIKVKNNSGNLSRTPANNFSEAENSINEKIQKIKRPGNPNIEGDKILELQRQIENSNGSTVTKTEANDFGTFIPASKFSSQETDNLEFTYVINNANNYVAGIAAQVEQRGATAGKIWIAVGLANGDTGIFAIPDTIGIYYSNDNSASYVPYAKIAFSSHNKIDLDNIDMELIENVSGTKYLHIVFGYTTNGGYGQRLIGYTIVSVPTLGYAGSTLIPPGYNANSIYTKARITSDNARYPGVPYVTIAVTQDSVSGGQNYFMSKVCRVLSPYTVTPVVTYLAQSIYSVAPGHNYVISTDVANYHNGDDSLIFVLSAYPGYEPYLYLYKGYSNTVVYPISSGILSPTGDNMEYARVAANGGTDQKSIMITYTDDYLNSGDFDQWILYTDDAANWNASTLDYSSFNNSRYGDIIGRRDADGSFAVSFKNIYGNMENVSMYGFTSLSLTSSLPSLNTDYANSLAAPKPLFRHLDSDSCLNIWSYFYSVQSTGGCSVSNLYVRCALEGYYDDATDLHSLYTGVSVLLADASPPYNIIDTGYALLDYDGQSNVFAFPDAPTGDFYLVLKQYNTLETWSTAPVHVEPNYYNFYDFTTSDAQAFGNNMMLKGAKWCIYSGDVDQDGTIDLTDVVIVYNDVINFVVGEVSISDLNGDYYTDLNDLLIVYNNSTNFVIKMSPL